MFPHTCSRKGHVFRLRIPWNDSDLYPSKIPWGQTSVKDKPLWPTPCVTRRPKKKSRNEGVEDRKAKSSSSRRRWRRRKQTLASLGGEQMEPQERREEEERGKEGGKERWSTQCYGARRLDRQHLLSALCGSGNGWRVRGTLRARKGGKQRKEKLGKEGG